MVVEYLATVEDINTVLLEFERQVLDLTVDTGFVESADYYFYDFFKINRTTSNSKYSYTFLSSIPLNCVVVECLSDNLESVTAVTGGFQVDCSDTEDLVIRLHFFNDGNNSYVKVIPVYNLEYGLACVNGTGKITGVLKDKDGEVLPNVVITDNDSHTVTTDSDGSFSLNFSAESDGIGTLVLDIDDGDLYPLQFNNVSSVNGYGLSEDLVCFKDSRNSVGFVQFSPKGSTPIAPSDAVLIYNGKRFVSDGLLFDLDCRGVFDDSIRVELEIDSVNSLDGFDGSFTIPLSYYTVDSLSDLSDAVGKIGTVFLSDAVTSDTVVSVNSDLHIVNNLDDDCTIKFKVSNGAKLTLTGGSYTGSDLFVVENGSLVLEDCSFSDGSHIVYSSIDGNVTITDCSFTDNTGSDLVLNGKSTLLNNQFSQQDNWCSTEPAFIINNGNLSLNYNKFNLEYDGSLTTDGFAFVMFKVSEKALVNTITGETMKKNNSFRRLTNNGDLDAVVGNSHLVGSVDCFTWTVENTNTVFSMNMEVSDV